MARWLRPTDLFSSFHFISRSFCRSADHRVGQAETADVRPSSGGRENDDELHSYTHTRTSNLSRRKTITEREMEGEKKCEEWAMWNALWHIERVDIDDCSYRCVVCWKLFR